MDLEEQKGVLEEAIRKLTAAQQKRMRLEGQYEAALTTLKKLGFNSIQEAAVHLKTENEKFESNLASLVKDVDTFESEFNKAFEGVLND